MNGVHATVADSNPLIRIRDLSFRYSADRPLLEGVSLDLHASERLGLVGANGSGKSSLLQLLMGLEFPSGGSIHLFGHECRREEDFRPMRGRVGLLFQDADDQLFCPTVEEDVAFGPLNQGYSHDQAEAMVGKVLEQLSIAHLARRMTHQLSGGEKRLAALAGLLAMAPEVLLLDEPTTGLDDEAQARVVEVLLGLPQAMVLVSHDRAFLRTTATRSLQLRQGTLEPLSVPLKVVQRAGSG